MTTAQGYVMVIGDRNYSSWQIKDVETMLPREDICINPIENKLFTMDVFTMKQDTVECCLYKSNSGGSNIKKSIPEIEIQKSPVRMNHNISGVLILKNQRTFGRHENGKLMYKCVPDDKRIPVFLVPYELKYIGFEKVLTNLYVTFHFVGWTGKHPIGKITATIGRVDSLDNYYEYQLYCKSLNASIHKFTKITKDSVKDMNGEEQIMKDIYEKHNAIHEPIEDRTEWYVYSIDPSVSTDFDDAVSHTLVYDSKMGKIVNKLSIYISNVSLLLDHLHIWESFSRRVSTIYLPDRKRPMLPTILSDGLCSLIENKTRFAFTLDLHIDDGKIIDFKFVNTKIMVVKNFRYEEKVLLENEKYTTLVDLLRTMIPHNNYLTRIRNSHDVVSFMMVLMNHHTAKFMYDLRKGVFRNVIVDSNASKNEIPKNLNQEVSLFFKMWNGGSAQYIDIESVEENTHLRHDMLEIDAYLQITSPIRRLVDLLNLICIQKSLRMVTLTEKADSFYKEWIGQMEYINTSMRSIRKVQTDCDLITLVTKDPHTLKVPHEGYVFDKMNRNGIWQYTVYIPDIKMVSKLTTMHSLENFEKATFQLHLFQDEDSVKRKVRLSVIECDSDIEVQIESEAETEAETEPDTTNNH